MTRMLPRRNSPPVLAVALTGLALAGATVYAAPRAGGSAADSLDAPRALTASVQTGPAGAHGAPSREAAAGPAAVAPAAGGATNSADAAPRGGAVALVTAPGGNQARYRIREQLARIEFPSDAVGTTDAIRGALILGDDGAVDPERSRFTIDLTALRSDSDRRDNYVRRNTLRTELHPEATFAPTAMEGAPVPLPTEGTLHVRITGDLAINGVVRSTTWDARVRSSGGTFEGTAHTEFSFGEFDMPIPRVASVLSVTDRIRLEYDFVLVPAGEPAPRADG